jgi:hypothetical protein
MGRKVGPWEWTNPAMHVSNAISALIFGPCRIFSTFVADAIESDTRR